MLKKRRCPETGGEYLFRDGVCFSLEELLEAIEKKKTRLPVENSYDRTLAGLLRE